MISFLPVLLFNLIDLLASVFQCHLSAIVKIHGLIWRHTFNKIDIIVAPIIIFFFISEQIPLDIILNDGGKSREQFSGTTFLYL